MYHTSIMYAFMPPFQPTNHTCILNYIFTPAEHSRTFHSTLRHSTYPPPFRPSHGNRSCPHVFIPPSDIFRGASASPIFCAYSNGLARKPTQPPPANTSCHQNQNNKQTRKHKNKARMLPPGSAELYLRRTEMKKRKRSSLWLWHHTSLPRTLPMRVKNPRRIQPAFDR